MVPENIHPLPTKEGIKNSKGEGRCQKPKIMEGTNTCIPWNSTLGSLVSRLPVRIVSQ